MQELELKMQGGLMLEGGVIAGFYGNSIYTGIILLFIMQDEYNLLTKLYRLEDQSCSKVYK